MRRTPIHRGGIISAGYDPIKCTLDIEFDTKRVLRYESIGREIADRFIHSASPLSYYRDVIADEYSSYELSARSLTEDAPVQKKGVPRELKALFGE